MPSSNLIQGTMLDTLTADEFFFKYDGTVTLCGSTQFFFEYLEASRLLTFKNWIVLQCGSYGHSFCR